MIYSKLQEQNMVKRAYNRGMPDGLSRGIKMVQAFKGK